MDSECIGHFSSWISTLSCVLVVALVAHAPVEGQPQVIGSAQPIVAVVGDDVILPCHLEPRYNVENGDLTVEWSRPDFKLDLRDRLNKKYVHVYRNGRELLAMKNPQYFGRTVLFRDGLKYGNVSLKLANVTFADQGKYRCFIPKLHSQMKESVIQLIVESSFPQITTTSTAEKPWGPVEPDQNEERDVEGALPTWRIGTVAAVSVLLITTVGVLVFFVIRFKWPKHQRDLENYKPPSNQTDRLVEALAG